MYGSVYCYVSGCLLCDTMSGGVRGEFSFFPGPRGVDFVESKEGKLLLMTYGPF